MSLIARLRQLKVLHHAIRAFRVQRVVHAVLTRVPIVRRLAGSGVRYRIQHLESFVMADEIFGARCYAEPFARKPVQSFIDVGSNVGYFVCFAAEATGSRDIVGLAVDANAEMVEETRWHVETNALHRVRVAHGAAGFGPEVSEVTFFVAASNVASSAQPHQNPQVPEKGRLVETRVPTIQLASAWRAHAGDAPVDLLKIDVEGSELELIRNSAELLRITSSIVLEWHKWVVSLSEVEAALEPHGFHLGVIISEDRDAGVGLFVRD
jgi:FkbM family methyltransferase